MTNNDYLEHLADIKGIIEQRTKFRALSGLSGILAGIYALIGAFAAHRLIYNSPALLYRELQNHIYSPVAIKLLLLAGVVLASAVATGIYFSAKNSRKMGEKLWNPAAVKVAGNFLIPMVAGGIFVIAMLYQGHLTLISPACLLFYGLALINAANYTFSDVKTLGIAVLAIGCAALFSPGYGLYFWALGFGLMHILYGAIMYFKYEK
jgi:hypothetical protein